MIIDDVKVLSYLKSKKKKKIKVLTSAFVISRHESNPHPIKTPRLRFMGSYFPDAPDPGSLKGKWSKERSAARYHLYHITMRYSSILLIPPG